jgi:PAS domain S-box-containing protein
MPTAFLFEDRNRRLQYVNRPFLKIFGSDGNPVDFIGADCAAVAEMSRPPFADPDEFMERVDELLADGEDCFGDIVRLTNGQSYERDFVVVKQEDNVLGYLWKYHNVSAWRNEHETLTRILGSAMDAVIVIDCQGRVEFWNSAAEVIFGYSEAEAQGALLAELIVPHEYRDAHRAGLERYMKTRVSQIMNQIIKITALHQDGDTLDVELSLACIDDGPEPRYSAFIRRV